MHAGMLQEYTNVSIMHIVIFKLQKIPDVPILKTIKFCNRKITKKSHKPSNIYIKIFVIFRVQVCKRK